MTDVAEIVVRATPEGVEDVESQMENLESQVSETVDSVEDQTSSLTDLANRISGLMQTVIAGLAIATAGLLSQVPILGELMGSVVAVVQALAFQIDKRLRPVLQPIVNRFYDLADAIYQGNFSQAANEFKAIVRQVKQLNIIENVISTFRGIIRWIRNNFDLKGAMRSTWDGVSNFLFNQVPQTFKKLMNETDWRGIFEIIIDAIQRGAWLTNQLLKVVRSINWEKLAREAGRILRGMGETLTNIMKTIVDVIDWSEVAKEVVDGIINALSRGQSPDYEATANVGIGTDRYDLGDPSNTTDGGDDGFLAGRFDGIADINIDGERLNETEARFRRDDLARRGG